MKRILALLAVLFSVLTVFCACTPGTGNATTGAVTTEASPATTATSTVTTEAPPVTTEPVTTQTPDPYPGYLVIAEGKDYQYRLVTPADPTDRQTELIQNFSKEIKSKLNVGTSIKSIRETTSPTGAEIVICCTKKRPAAEEALKEACYTGYDVRVADGNIIVTAYRDEQLESALNALSAGLKIVDKSKKVLALPADFAASYQGDVSKPTYPAFATAEGKLRGAEYGCGEGLKLLSYEKVAATEFNAYVKLLGQLGFEQYAKNTIGRGNYFYTFVHSGTKTTIHLAYYTSQSVMTLSYGPSSLYLPEDQTDYVKTNEVTLAQPGRLGATSSAPGMGFIMQLEDGRYIVMDSGPSKAEDVTAFYDYMVEHKPASHKKPQIAMWIFSHMDGDHYNNAVEFMEKYQTRVELETVAFNAPDFLNITMTNYNVKSGAGVVDEILQLARNINPGVNYWKFHTGEKITLGGVTMEVLFTHEEMFPNPMPYGNHTCSAWRFDIHGTKAVFLGDCEVQLNQWMAVVFGDELECDFVQTAHHGFNGAVNAIYEKTDPKVVFWTVDYDRFMTSTQCLGTAFGYEFNAILRSQDWTRGDGTSGRRQHFAASTTTIVTFAQNGSYTINRASDN